MDELQKNQPHTLDEFEAVLDREFSVFKQGEQYSYVKDMKNAYRESLSKSRA